MAVRAGLRVGSGWPGSGAGAGVRPGQDGQAAGMS